MSVNLHHLAKLELLAAILLASQSFINLEGWSIAPVVAASRAQGPTEVPSNGAAVLTEVQTDIALVQYTGGRIS